MYIFVVQGPCSRSDSSDSLSQLNSLWFHPLPWVGRHNQWSTTHQCGRSVFLQCLWNYLFCLQWTSMFPVFSIRYERSKTV